MASKKNKKKPKFQTFQDTIINLQKFWSKNGCVILQPYDMEVGAGTFHPATTLRSVGSKPWKAAYVQPSRRPGDGRYGENPNRVQQHHQYQVILKPSPIDLQDLYLGSLKIIGIDNCKRFVDNLFSHHYSMTGSPGFYPFRVKLNAFGDVVDFL